jgi:hypothetical protein
MEMTAHPSGLCDACLRPDRPVTGIPCDVPTQRMVYLCVLCLMKACTLLLEYYPRGENPEAKTSTVPRP